MAVSLLSNKKKRFRYLDDDYIEIIQSFFLSETRLERFNTFQVKYFSQCEWIEKLFKAEIYLQLQKNKFAVNFFRQKSLNIIWWVCLFFLILSRNFQSIFYSWTLKVETIREKHSSKPESSFLRLAIYHSLVWSVSLNYVFDVETTKLVFP